MPFEVYPIKPLSKEGEKHADFDHTPESAAQDIQDIYNKVAENGGKIVAEHTLTLPGSSSYGVHDKSFLFLVAELPETK